MNLNVHLEASYNKLLKIFDELDVKIASMRSLKYRFHSAVADLNRCAYRKEEYAFVRECELKMVPYYQKALEMQYDEFKEQKEIGYPEQMVISSWVLTVDQNGNPVKTTVIDVKNGYPVYANGCKDIEIEKEAQHFGNCRYELNRFLKSNTNMYEMKAEALELKKKGALGMSDPPTPNYDLGGLSGGRLDAAAWQNYAIENGMVRRTDYDKTLDGLLVAVDKCIEFYEKAISIV